MMKYVTLKKKIKFKSFYFVTEEKTSNPRHWHYRRQRWRWRRWLSWRPDDTKRNIICKASTSTKKERKNKFAATRFCICYRHMSWTFFRSSFDFAGLKYFHFKHFPPSCFFPSLTFSFPLFSLVNFRAVRSGVLLIWFKGKWIYVNKKSEYFKKMEGEK